MSLNIHNLMKKKCYGNKENNDILHHLHQTKNIILPIQEVILSSYNIFPKKETQKCSSIILHIISRSLLMINVNGDESKKGILCVVGLFIKKIVFLK